MTTAGSGDSPYSPDGTFWWLLETYPGSRRIFGREKRLAAWLWHCCEIGDVFTMPGVRDALGGDISEHLDRRLRNLDPDGWIFHTQQEDGSLAIGQYRLIEKGRRIWVEPRAPRDVVSRGDRKEVFKRDGYRCVLCGVADGESYPDRPQVAAVLTIGHRRAQSRGGAKRVDLENLQTECAECNMPARDRGADPESFEEIYPDVKRLGRDEKTRLLDWMRSGRKTRSRLDEAYDRARKMTPSERSRMIEALDLAVNGKG
ncbi:HNH endonuclease [Streptomyces sp. NPDC048266]|uniref:HNH endonuclease n=1 Tax=Streptomyces sp. NPDC048266 TaxID=3155787 RepID=UPI0033E80C66